LEKWTAFHVLSVTLTKMTHLDQTATQVAGGNTALPPTCDRCVMS